jgi:ATP-binding cassette subfamily B protein
MILVLEKGEIVERGNHRQLVDHNGVYAGLLNESIVETSEPQAVEA